MRYDLWWCDELTFEDYIMESSDNLQLLIEMGKKEIRPDVVLYIEDENGKQPWKSWVDEREK